MFQELADFSIQYLMKKGASYAEARLESYNSEGFLLKNGVPSVSGFDISNGIGVRFVLKNTLGFVAINKLDKTSVKTAIDRSFILTKNAIRINDPVYLAEEKKCKAKYEVKQKINFLDIGPEDKLKALGEIDKNLSDVNYRYFFLSNQLVDKYFVNSEGINITSRIPVISLYYYLTLVEGNNSVQKYWSYGQTKGWEGFNEWNLRDKLRLEVNAIKENMKHGKKLVPGKMDLVVGPEVIGIMAHESVGHPYEADRIFGREAAQAGESFVNVNMINSKIGSEIVNVVDDPCLEGAYGYYLYDDEGVKARKRTLIKNGIINEFLHNRETAKQMNLPSNGSARACNYHVETLVRMGNTFLLPGDYSEEELIEGVKKGVLMKNFNEWNIDDVRLNQKYVGGEAYFIENGKIKYPVKMPVLEIMTPDLYKSIDAVGKNIELHAASCGKGEPMQGIRVSHGGPSLRLRNVRMK